MCWKSENVIMSYLYEVTGYYDKEMKLPRYFIKILRVNDYNGIPVFRKSFCPEIKRSTPNLVTTPSPDTSFDQIQGWMSGTTYS